MPGVLIVEAFGQAAAALTAHGIDLKEYEGLIKLLNLLEENDDVNKVFSNLDWKKSPNFN